MRNITIIEILKGIASGEIKNETLFVDELLDNRILVKNNDLYFLYEDGEEVKVQVYQVINLIEDNIRFDEY